MPGKTSKPKKPAKKTAKAAAKRTATKAAKPLKASPKKPAAKSQQPVLLSGGNPQIAKGYGDAPVKEYIAAIPDWKRDIARELDRLIETTVPGVRRAVKWNSPLYGVEEGHWFASFHCFTNYVKVTFFRGTSLEPVPPGQSKHKEIRYLDIRKGELDAAQFIDWIKQASLLPGEKM